MEKLKLGYMVPEFPGQTHTFFWREIAELEKNNIEVNIVSTRSPRAGKSPHEWTKAAEARTTYLSPLKVSAISLLSHALKNFSRVLRCVLMILKADDTSNKERLLLAGSIIYSLKLSMIAKSEGWHHLHSHFCYRAADIVLFASIISRVPYSISKHGPDYSIGNQNNKWKHAAFGTVITQKMLRDLLKERSGDITQNIYIISMGVDTDAFCRSSDYRPPRLDETFIIFCCARIDPGKGQMDLVHLAERLRNNGQRFEIRIGGNTSKSGEHYFEKIKSAITASKLSDAVILLGPLSEADVKQNLESCHAFLLPSRNEPLGVAYMEAMAMEVPTIANNAGGVPELIDDKFNGLLCEAGNIESLESAINWLITNPSEAKLMGERARSKIIEKYSSALNARKLANAIESVQKNYSSPLAN